MKRVTDDAMMEQPEIELGFFEQMERHSEILSSPVALGLKRDRWLLVIMIIGVGLAFLPFGEFATDEVAFWTTIVGLTLQLGGMAIFTLRQMRDVVPDFIDPKRKFAVEMDGHFRDCDRVLSWLRTYPEEERSRRLAYIDARQENLSTRFPLIFGPVDKVGLLPALIGVFVQIQAIKTLSVPVMLLGVAITALYGMSFLIVRYRLQLEGYRRLIRASMRD